MEPIYRRACDCDSVALAQDSCMVLITIGGKLPIALPSVAVTPSAFLAPTA